MQTNAFPKGSGAGKDPRKNRARVLAVMLCAPAGVLFAAACSNSKPASPPQAAGVGTVRYVVTTETAPFYKYGPAQPSGPDLRLKKDELVTMVARHYGYSRVTDPDGDTGYVPTDDIVPAPSQAPVLASSSKKSQKTRAVPPDFEQPNDAALPSKQPPGDEPVPSFRY